MSGASLRGWRPSPFLRVSLVIHAAAFVLLFSHWLWAIAIVLLNHAVIAIAGLLPRSALLGVNLKRLPAAASERGEIALTFDDGPHPEVTPQVLDMLERHHVRATFFCIGERAAAHPDICRDIVARGHRIENHGQRHYNTLAFSGVGGWRREIDAAQKTLADITGQRPQFFRPLAGIRNPFLDPALHLCGVRLASWTRRGYDTRCGDADIILARLTRNLAAGDILLLHDGNAAQNSNGQPVVLEVLPRLLAELAKHQLHPAPLTIS